MRQDYEVRERERERDKLAGNKMHFPEFSPKKKKNEINQSSTWTNYIHRLAEACPNHTDRETLIRLPDMKDITKTL